MRKLASCIILLFPCVLFAQSQPLSVGGMELTYLINEDSAEITLSAPTRGWIGIGFNDQNSIVKSDLLLFHILNGEIESLDMHVVGAGNPKEDVELGGKYSIRVIDGKEIADKTMIRFSIALNSKDPYDFKHELLKDFWLIMAYSTHDDFAHHSRMRKHVKYRFENH